MKVDPCFVLALVASALMTAAGCTNPAEVSGQRERAIQATPTHDDTQTATVVLPKGSPEAGRQAFLDLECTTCHRVVGEHAFPAPIGEAQGPDLDQTLGLRPTSELAAAIIMPSHSMSLRTSAEVKKRLEGMLLSPMGDFSRTMTVRQLADLLAYLGSVGTVG